MLKNARTVGRESHHYYWNKAHSPIISIATGESVDFEINEVTSNQISPTSKHETVAAIDESKLYPLSGPIFVENATPDDTLEVTVEEIETADWGWSAIVPGLGLLPEFNKPFIWIWNLSDHSKKAGYTEFKNGIRVPLHPFCGVMGVAPSEPGPITVLPPGMHGGNMDIKHLVKGSKLQLPIWNKGALFSVGDLHAAQGDGEVCITAIECPGRVKLKFDLLKGKKLPAPRYWTPGIRQEGDLGEFCTTGISPDLLEASRIAVRGMIQYLAESCSLTNEEAYILCSVAADLRIHEVVDAPNWVVGLAIKKSILA
jgi:acetamidase/formamidase